MYVDSEPERTTQFGRTFCQWVSSYLILPNALAGSFVSKFSPPYSLLRGMWGRRLPPTLSVWLYYETLGTKCECPKFVISVLGWFSFATLPGN